MKRRINHIQFQQSLTCMRSAFLNGQVNNQKEKQSAEKELWEKSKIKVNQYGKYLFPDGNPVSFNTEITNVSDLNTLLKTDPFKPSNILYDVKFCNTENLSSVASIYVAAEKRDRILIIKSGTSLKSQYLYAIGFLFKTVSECGLRKNTLFETAYLNKGYKREPKIDIDHLFKVEDVTYNAKAIQPLIEKQLYQLNKVLNNSSPPPPQIGAYCQTCNFKLTCFNSLSKTSISKLKGNRSYHLSKFIQVNHTEKFSEIPRKLFSKTQLIQVDSTINESEYINKRGIQNFLKDLNISHQHYYADFETLHEAIPIFTGTYPYQQIPFQYCVLLNEEKGKIQRRDFLAKNSIVDPRKEFIKNFLIDTKEPGNIICFNAKFEIKCLEEIARHLPEYKVEIAERVNRIKDLMPVFSEKLYYHPLFEGRYSLKIILTVIFPKLSYENLKIPDSATAILSFQNLNNISFKNKILLENDIKEYCYRDTYGLFKLIEFLKSISNFNS